MTLHLCAFVAPGARLRDGRAVEEAVGALPESALAPGRLVRLGAVDAVVADLPAGASSADAAAAHRALIGALFDAGATVLPAHAGQRFASSDALASSVGDAAGLAHALTRLEGLVEMTAFTALPGREAGEERSSPQMREPEPAAGRGPGARYLARIRHRERELQRQEEGRRTVTERWREALREAVRDIARDERVTAHPSGRGVLVSHLVARADSAPYQAAAGRVPGAAGGPTIVRGPFAPFSFATDAPTISDGGGR